MIETLDENTTIIQVRTQSSKSPTFHRAASLSVLLQRHCSTPIVNVAHQKHSGFLSSEIVLSRNLVKIRPARCLFQWPFPPMGCPWTSEVSVQASIPSQCPMVHVGSHGMLWDRVNGHPMDSAGTSGHPIVPIDCR